MSPQPHSCDPGDSPKSEARFNREVRYNNKRRMDSLSPPRRTGRMKRMLAVVLTVFPCVQD
ncbi:unnamed protein product [Arctogadus glacialis]